MAPAPGAAMTLALPRAAWVGAALLACLSGMVNVAGYLGFEHQAVSHLTGTTTLLGNALAQGELRAAAQLAGVALAFVLGAAVAGLLVGDSRQLDRRYADALLLAALVLCGAAVLFPRQPLAGALLAAAACGLQNALATIFSNALIRTSHVSGMFTDLGIGVGHLLRGTPLQRQRLHMCALVIACFFAGAALGAWLFVRIGYLALAVPASALGLAALALLVLLRRQRRAAADA